MRACGSSDRRWTDDKAGDSTRHALLMTARDAVLRRVAGLQNLDIENPSTELISKKDNAPKKKRMPALSRCHMNESVLSEIL